MTTSTIYNYAFSNALRGRKHTTITELKEGYVNDTESYRFPKGFDGDYTKALAKENIFRKYATVIDAPNSDGYIQTVTSTAEAQITDECATFPEDNDAFNTIRFSAYKIATLCKLSDTFVYDVAFDVEKYLKNEFARRFGKAEESIFLNGNGTTEPTGLISSAQIGVETADITYDDVIKLFFSLKPEYRKKAVWLLNDETILKLRTLKDDAGNYLWNSTNDTILGRPVEVSPYMPNEANGNTPILFGDLSFYWILEREPLSVRTLTEKFALEGIVGYAAYERLDGKLIRPEAVKGLHISE